MSTEALDRLISSCISTLWRMFFANLLCTLIGMCIIDIRVQWIINSRSSEFSTRSNVNSVNVGGSRTFDDNVHDILIKRGELQK